VAYAVLLSVFGFVTADVALASGSVYSMAVDTTQQHALAADPYQGAPMPPCPYAVGHGNVYNLAYSKIYIGSLTYPSHSTTTCLTARTYVTGCSGLNCPSSNWVPATRPKEWFQAQIAWVSVVESHSSVQSYVDNWRLNHYCVPGIGC